MAQTTELNRLAALSARIGSNPLYTQGSTGNVSMKLNRVLWIKASGKWMADALREDILAPLDLDEVQTCVKHNVDPTGRYPNASIETAMHAVFPHRVVLHVHCVNTVAWAVRKDAPVELQAQLRGLPWQWIPYVSSGLNLAHAIGKALPCTEVLVLGNHGLVLGGVDCNAVENLLCEVQRRLAIHPRSSRPPDYAVLTDLAHRLSWETPDDDDVHALGTDEVAGTVLSGGILYPCQAIFSNSSTPEALFRPVPYPGRGDRLEGHATRPFLILKGSGVILNRTATPAERAMIRGLAQVVQRIGSSTPIRYLTQAETPEVSSALASRYRELSNASHGIDAP